MHARLLLSFLCLLSAPLHAQVVVVDDQAGAGVDFTNLQEAIDGSADGSILLIRPGSYHTSVTFKVEYRSLTLIGDEAAGPVVLLNSIVIGNIESDQRVVVRGMQTFRLEVRNCSGNVWIEDLRGNSMLVKDSEQVALVGCRFGDESITSGMAVNASTAAVLECDGLGSKGIDGDIEPYSGLPLPGGPGGPAFFSLGGAATFLGGNHFHGGPGGKGLEADAFHDCSDGGNGGVALQVGGYPDASAVLNGGLLEGGAAGLGGAGCADGVAGAESGVEAGSVLADLGGPHRFFRMSAPVREGEDLEMKFTAQPGDRALVLASATPGMLFRPGMQGVLLVDQPGRLLGPVRVRADGSLRVRLLMPDLAAQVEGRVLYATAAFVDASGRFLLGGSSTTVVLDSVF